MGKKYHIGWATRFFTFLVVVRILFSKIFHHFFLLERDFLLVFSVFWDLYCAAPERRDQCDHSSEAKAFHDYGFVSSGYGVNGAHVSWFSYVFGYISFPPHRLIALFTIFLECWSSSKSSWSNSPKWRYAWWSNGSKFLSSKLKLKKI